MRIAFEGLGVIQFDRTKASVECRNEAERNGWLQRLADRAALKAPERKVGMSDEAWRSLLSEHKRMKFERVQELAEHYQTGSKEWTLREDGPGSLLVQALMRVKNCSRDVAKKYLDSRTKEQLATIRKMPEIIKAEADIRLERAPVADTSALDDFEEFEMDAEIAEESEGNDKADF